MIFLIIDFLLLFERLKKYFSTLSNLILLNKRKIKALNKLKIDNWYALFRRIV